MSSQCTFPVFKIRCGLTTQPIYACPDETNYALLFTAQQQAERYIDQHEAVLSVVEIAGTAQLIEFLISLPSEIDAIVWDATLEADYYKTDSIGGVLLLLWPERQLLN